VGFDTRALTDISILDGSPRNKELEEGVGATIAKVRSTNGLMAKISVGSKFPWVQNSLGFKIFGVGFKFPCDLMASRANVPASRPSISPGFTYNSNTRRSNRISL